MAHGSYPKPNCESALRLLLSTTSIAIISVKLIIDISSIGYADSHLLGHEEATARVEFVCDWKLSVESARLTVGGNSACVGMRSERRRDNAQSQSVMVGRTHARAQLLQQVTSSCHSNWTDAASSSSSSAAARARQTYSDARPTNLCPSLSLVLCLLYRT